MKVLKVLIHRTHWESQNWEILHFMKIVCNMYDVQCTVIEHLVCPVEIDLPSGNLYNIAIDNISFIVDLPIQNGDFQ